MRRHRCERRLTEGASGFRGTPGELRGSGGANFFTRSTRVARVEKRAKLVEFATDVGDESFHKYRIRVFPHPLLGAAFFVLDLLRITTACYIALSVVTRVQCT